MSKEKVAAAVLSAAFSLVLATRASAKKLKQKLQDTTPVKPAETQPETPKESCIVIKFQGVVIGAIKSLTTTENYTGTISMMRLNKKSLSEVFTNFSQEKSQMYPIQIFAYDKPSNKTYHIENVWILEMGKVFTESDFVIAKDVKFDFENVKVV